MGFSGSMPIIIIGAMSGTPNAPNSNEFLSITPEQATWIASLSYIILPIGSFASGFISGKNPPINLSNLIAYLNVCVSLGAFLPLLLNTMIRWRMIALIGFAIPFFSTLSLSFIPETPQWLLSKNRSNQANNSLRWLRGWTSSEAVAQEFNELRQHSERSKSCNECIQLNQQCLHPPPKFSERMSEFKRKRNLKPFIILIPLFFLTQFTGLQSMGPFVMQIFQAYESPIRSDRAAAMLSIIDNLAHVTLICLVRFTGKRKLYLSIAFGVFLTSLVLSCYVLLLLPTGYDSFNHKKFAFHLDNSNLAYIPTICLFLWEFLSKCGFSSMPWMLISELFPFKTRGVAIGIAAAINYTFGFASRKSYYSLETALSLPGVTLLYCATTGVGFILMYFIMPETEGFSLEDIERHFSDDSKKLTDRHIGKAAATRM